MTIAIGPNSGRFTTNAALAKSTNWPRGCYLKCDRLKLVIQFQRRKLGFTLVGFVVKAPPKSQFKVGATYDCFHVEDFERTNFKLK